MAGDAVVQLNTLPAIRADKSCSYPLSPKQLYTSLALPPGSQCIRLLDLYPSSPSDGTPTARHISGHLRVADLQQRPSFQSLSYVWGEKASPSHVVKLQVPGCDIEVTENCYQALWHIRKQFGAVSIWVDSICINQDDKREKEGQISLMQEIYSSASSVYIWLGIGNEESDKAMNYLRKQGSVGQRLPLTLLAPEDWGSNEGEYRTYRKQVFKDTLCEHDLRSSSGKHY